MSKIERWMIRRLHGELSPDEAGELDRRLASDPELARAYSRLRMLWEGLESPPLEAHDKTLTERVVAAASAPGLARPGLARPGLASLRGVLLPRLAAGVALFLGTWVGVSLEPVLRTVEPTPTARVADHQLAASSSEIDFSVPAIQESEERARMTDGTMIDSAILDRLGEEDLFAPAPTLSESFWLESEDVLHRENPEMAQGSDQEVP